MESKNYLNEQLITYIGNKRKLLGFIESEINNIKKENGLDKLVILDGFSGSGVVSRLFKQHSSRLISNDMERYAKVIADCYLSNKSSIDISTLNKAIDMINNISDDGNIGIIEKLYAPKDNNNVLENERVFYTNKNAKKIDSIRKAVFNIDGNLQKYLLGPLLSQASIHANTSGVFKGFYKNSKTGRGQFGGNAQNCLTRITSDIHIPYPVFSNYDCDVETYNQDINILADKLKDIDIAYFDPPYNQHPYGSNYFMLNVISDYIEPQEVSIVSGIPKNWNRSAYNTKDSALHSLLELVRKVQAKYVIISYSTEGFISFDDMNNSLSRFGKLTILNKEYSVFKGSRNLKDRNDKLNEMLFVLKKH